MARKYDTRAGRGLTGSFWICRVRSATREIPKLLPSIADQMEFRAHCLKLRYWPKGRVTENAGQVIDMDWEWVRALRSQQIAELRIDDRIGGCDNLRAYFWVDRTPVGRFDGTIWILRVMQKKRNDLTQNQLKILRARRRLVERC